MKKIILTAIAVACTLSLGAQDTHMLTAAGITPQRLYLNPAMMPEHSYMSLPLLGSLGFNVGTSLGYGSLIKNGYIDGASLARDMKNKAMRADLSLDIFSFGVRFKDDNLVSVSNRLRVSTGMGYPSGLFGYIFDNPIGYSGSFDIPLKADILAWNETAIGYSRRINDNWSVGGRVKYVMGLVRVNTRATGFRIEKDIMGSTVTGDVDITGGNIDFGGDELIDPANLTGSPGAAFDIGAAWRSDDARWRIGAGLSDIGFIKWSGGSSSRIYSSESKSYRFEGFGDLEEIFGSASFDDMIDSVYNDLLDCIELDTVHGYAHTGTMPITMNVSGEFDIRGDKRHVVSLDLLGTFNPKQPLYYSVTAGYRYTTGNGRFSALATLSHKLVDPLALGLGIMANTRNFQFFVLGDASVGAFAGNLSKVSGMSLRTGINFFFGCRDGCRPHRGGEKYRYVNSY